MTPSEYLWLKDALKLQVSPKQEAACIALEAHGKRFCVDFGYENAESLWHSLNIVNFTYEDMRFLAECGVRFD